MTLITRTDDPVLADHAAAIRALGKRVVGDVIEIGRRLVDCKARVGHGGWLPWLDREFGWTDETARRFINVAELSKSHNLLNFDIPISGLYLIAAPSVPEEVRTDVIERAEAGERFTHARVKDIIVARGEREILREAKRIRAERSEERRSERLQEFAEISKGNTDLSTAVRYPIVLADPPWFFEGYTSEEAYDRAPRYPTMRIDQICALPVRDLATDAAILFLWSTSAHLRMAFEAIEAWGFSYSTAAVWVKTECAPGLGHIVRQQHETLLIARRGDFPGPPPSTRHSSVIYAPRGAHSVKPKEAYEMIESMYAGLPRIELFARGAARPGWATWGNQAAPAALDAATWESPADIDEAAE